MRWRRVCVDVAEDGEVWSGSIEWHPDITEDRGPEAITVFPIVADASPEQMFAVVLAEPWYQEALPFPEQGWIVEPDQRDSRPWERQRHGRRR